MYLAHISIILWDMGKQWPRSAFCNEFDCKSKDLEFNPGPIPYFRENDHEIIYIAILHLQLIREGLLSVTSESIMSKYWLTALKPKLHVHDFGHGRTTIHPDLSSRDAA